MVKSNAEREMERDLIEKSVKMYILKSKEHTNKITCSIRAVMVGTHKTEVFSTEDVDSTVEKIMSLVDSVWIGKIKLTTPETEYVVR